MSKGQRKAMLFFLNSSCPSPSCACRKLSSQNSSLLESRSSQSPLTIERTSRGGSLRQDLVNLGGKNVPQFGIWQKHQHAPISVSCWCLHVNLYCPLQRLWILKQRIWAKTFATNPDLHIRVGQGRGDYFILPLLDYPLACI